MKTQKTLFSTHNFTGSSHRYLERERSFYTNRVDKAWNGVHIMHGRIPDNNSIMLVSNDYLAISRHPDILRAQADAILANGNGLLMSGIFLHGDNPQAELEKRLAVFMKAEHTVMCQSGWSANVGLLQAIADDKTPVYIDLFSHMSFWDGIKHAGAKSYAFYHNNLEHLERKIKKHGPGIIAVDSVYSTNGSICPLEEITELGLKYNCVLVVDESHSLGTHGTYGEGLVASLGLENKIHFRTASLAKAFAGRAGLITCSDSFSDYFKFTSTPAIFSSTLLLHEIYALNKTLDVIIAESDRRKVLHKNAGILRDELSSLGYNVDISKAQIIPLEVGTEAQTINLRNALEKNNIFGSIFCPPATAQNRALVRLSVNSSLTEEQLNSIISACAAIRTEVDVASWSSTKRKNRC
ncbi:MAG: quorum-sensing autoinducer CAI-1 synthase [Gammaproteobacteria bacterium]|nr:quorum-sensing autoinducer CAI-1 synthase [Gammaproteobacteria bacterium]